MIAEDAQKRESSQLLKPAQPAARQRSFSTHEICLALTADQICRRPSASYSTLSNTAMLVG